MPSTIFLCLHASGFATTDVESFGKGYNSFGISVGERVIRTCLFSRCCPSSRADGRTFAGLPATLRYLEFVYENQFTGSRRELEGVPAHVCRRTLPELAAMRSYPEILPRYS